METQSPAVNGARYFAPGRGFFAKYEEDSESSATRAANGSDQTIAQREDQAARPDEFLGHTASAREVFRQSLISRPMTLPMTLLVSPADVIAAASHTQPPDSAPVVVSTPPNQAPMPLGDRRKRAVDLAVSSLMLVALAPALLLVALLIKLTSRGPVLFAHKRVGYNGAAFNCLKFRTMEVDADARLKELLENDKAAADEWRATQKLRNDPRITMVGHFLRKSSLDELPQLVNVLRGEMSCVGPRPVTQEELNRYGARAAAYVQARPGLSGLWQVCGRSERSYDERVALDSLYVSRWSLRLDLAILARTLPAVLKIDETA